MQTLQKKTDPVRKPDVAKIRARARRSVEEGAVTADYRADREAVIERLNDALATEFVCVLRYRLHHFMADGLESEPIASEFLVHADTELAHADRLAKRIVQLGGEPDLSPRRLTERSHAEYVECPTLEAMVRENLVAERIAVESYRDLIRFVGEDDPTTRRLLEDILAQEEGHADELADLLESSSK